MGIIKFSTVDEMGIIKFSTVDEMGIDQVGSYLVHTLLFKTLVTIIYSLSFCF